VGRCRLEAASEEMAEKYVQAVSKRTRRGGPSIGTVADEVMEAGAIRGGSSATSVSVGVVGAMRGVHGGGGGAEVEAVSV